MKEKKRETARNALPKQAKDHEQKHNLRSKRYFVQRKNPVAGRERERERKSAEGHKCPKYMLQSSRNGKASRQC
jgi:hypothetical protein